MRADFTGQRFGRLICLERVKDGRTTKYVCYCNCGKETTVLHDHLKYGRTKSCGCIRREVSRNRARKTPGYTVKTGIWNYYKRNAVVRGLEWLLSRAQLETLISQPCRYCNRFGATTTKTPFGDVLQHNGIDRLDNQLGYTPENSVSCCKTCNQAKNSLTVTEFRTWAEALSKNLGAW